MKTKEFPVDVGEIKDVYDRAWKYIQTACEPVGEGEYDVNTMKAYMWKTISPYLTKTDSGEIERIIKAIKIDEDSIFYQMTPPCQMAVNEYIAEIFAKIRKESK